jgi:hypothetical protein
MALMFLAAANVTRFKAAPANNLTPEQIEAIATEMFHKFARSMLRERQTMFAPDGTIKTRRKYTDTGKHKPSLLTRKRSRQS